MQIHGLEPVSSQVQENVRHTPAGTENVFQQLLDAGMKPKALPEAPGSSNPTGSGTEPLVSLGTITREVSTVSELLYKSPFKTNCWNIVYNDVNTKKPFRKIKPGTEVFLNTATQEIVWGKGAETGIYSETRLAEIQEERADAGAIVNPLPKSHQPSMEPAPKPEGEEPQHPKKLVEAVKKFIGRNYEQMDCYELVVGGLTDMGVQYKGRGGLGEHLIKKASAGGYAYNHYLNGEGLVSASGSDIFKRRFLSIKDADGQADNLMAELSPVLREGQILSFSTRTRGHTGVISKRDGLWTFINSGTMDNNLAGKNGGKGVGEEGLKQEIQNWFRLAGRRGEGLKISLGTIDMTKLAAFGPGGELLSKKA